jgi:hypothetical protein
MARFNFVSSQDIPAFRLERNAYAWINQAYAPFRDYSPDWSFDRELLGPEGPSFRD